MPDATSFGAVTSFILMTAPSGMLAITNPVLQMRDLKDKEVRHLAEGSTASPKQVRLQTPFESVVCSELYTAQPPQ